MATVALVRCDSYEYRMVKIAVKRGISLLGGTERFVTHGEKILLKPNILVGERPEKCVTTHPAVFRAVGERFIEAGATVSYGDSPAVAKPAKAAKKAGLAEAAQALNIQLADFDTGVEHYFDQGLQKRKFTIARAVFDNDGVVSLPKLKTHGLEKFTGAVKNQFGTVPGMLKGECHFKLPDADDFAKMLVDLNTVVNPRLYVMDGIEAMEGNGPRGGTPKKMGVLLFASDPVAMDAVACRLIGLDPEHVPTIRYGMESGMGTFLEEEIALAGDAFDLFVQKEFKVDNSPPGPSRPGLLSTFLNRRVVAKPVINPKKCIRCGECTAICPARPHALFFREDDRSLPPVYDYDHCIKCFCCQEICPENAVTIKTPLLRRLFIN